MSNTCSNQIPSLTDSQKAKKYDWFLFLNSHNLGLKTSVAHYLTRMALYADEDGDNIYASVETISNLAGCTVRTGRNYISELIGEGLIVRINKNKRTNTVTYKINLSEMYKRGDKRGLKLMQRGVQIATFEEPECRDFPSVDDQKCRDFPSIEDHDPIHKKVVNSQGEECDIEPKILETRAEPEVCGESAVEQESVIDYRLVLAKADPQLVEEMVGFGFYPGSIAKMLLRYTEAKIWAKICWLRKNTLLKIREFGKYLRKCLLSDDEFASRPHRREIGVNNRPTYVTSEKMPGNGSYADCTGGSKGRQSTSFVSEGDGNEALEEKIYSAAWEEISVDEVSGSNKKCVPAPKSLRAAIDAPIESLSPLGCFA